jgi:hypothetical protein
MNREFTSITQEIVELINQWESRLSRFHEDLISERRNEQNRTIRQILGHMIDSASNNIHRIVHLQYRESPVSFPNYASEGNNDRWIAIQDYQHEDWNHMIQLWKYINLHWVHVVANISPEKLQQEWIAAPGSNISLKVMVTDYLRHFRLHLNEINALADKIQ